jgi:dCTP deaminase
MLVAAGVVDAPYSAINSASIDIHLGRYVLVERASLSNIARLDRKDSLHTVKLDLDSPELRGEYRLQPGEFILAQSKEIFNLPAHISAEYKLKSSMARIGLDHLNAGWCDAGWSGSVLTLELKNVTRFHTIVLTKGERIGQMVFFEHTPVPRDKSYATRGSYNGDMEVTGAKCSSNLEEA